MVSEDGGKMTQSFLRRFPGYYSLGHIYDIIAIRYVHLWVLIACICLLSGHEPVVERADEARRYSRTTTEDFKTDSRRRYIISGPVQWKPGELKIGPDASIRGTEESGPVAELALNLEWSQLSEAADATSIRVCFDFSERRSVAIEINRTVESKHESGTIKFFRLSRNDENEIDEELVRQQRFRGVLPSGSWIFRYRHGVLSLWDRERRVSLHYVESTDQPHLTWSLKQRDGTAICRSLVWRMTPTAPQWRSKPIEQLKGDELNKRQRWNDAVAAELRASNMLDRGKFDECLPVLGASLKTYVDLSGPEDVSSTRAALTIGNVLLQLGRIETAKELLVGMVPVQRAVFGEDHPAYAYALRGVGKVANAERKHLDAQNLYEQAYLIEVESMGGEHPETLRTLLSLCNLNLVRKDYERAVSVSERAVALRTKVFGSTSSEYITSLNGLASAYMLSKEYAKSVPVFEQVLAVLRKSEGERGLNAAVIHGELAKIYIDLGEFDKAERAYRELLAIREEKLGLQNPLTIEGMNLLGVFLCNPKRDYAASAALLEQVLAFHRQLGPQRPEYCYALTNLACSYLAMEKEVQAESLMLEAADLLLRINEPISESSAQCRSLLSQLFENTGRSDAAIQQARIALDISRQVFGEEDAKTADLMCKLGTLYFDANQPQLAQPLVTKALEIRRKVFGEKHLVTAETYKLLGELYVRDDQRVAVDMLSKAAPGSQRATET